MSIDNHVRLGVSPLSWTNDVLEDLGGDTPLEQCLAEAAQAGYQGIELGRKFPRDPAVLGPLLQGYGLQLASGWHSGRLAEQSVAEELEAVRPHARLLTALGAPVMVYGEVGGMPGAAPLDEPLSLSPALNGIDGGQYARRVTEFARKLQEDYGLGLAYHYHLMMLVETWPEIEAFFSQTGEAVGMLLDTGHAVAAGARLPDIIARFGNRINHIHLKDVRAEVLAQVRQTDDSFNDGVRLGMFTVPGDGSVDFAPVADFVRNSGYRGWLVVEAEQDPAKAPPLEAVSRASRFVKSLLETRQA
ncbi:MAG: myo-inosose-2 dehydratase [Pseudomonadota bacterium]|nr:myo-inosose-2 dehydratase [Pseudomonadota bacterium]